MLKAKSGKNKQLRTLKVVQEDKIAFCKYIFNYNVTKPKSTKYVVDYKN